MKAVYVNTYFNFFIISHVNARLLINNIEPIISEGF